MPKTYLLFFLTLIILSSCYYDKADKLYPVQAPCDTAGMTFTLHIKPILNTHCLNQSCHTTSNPNGGIVLESYTEVKKTIPGSRLINALKYLSGGSKNMPPAGEISDCEILKTEAWIHRGAPEN